MCSFHVSSHMRPVQDFKNVGLGVYCLGSVRAPTRNMSCFSSEKEAFSKRQGSAK